MFEKMRGNSRRSEGDCIINTSLSIHIIITINVVNRLPPVAGT